MLCFDLPFRAPPPRTRGSHSDAWPWRRRQRLCLWRVRGRGHGGQTSLLFSVWLVKRPHRPFHIFLGRAEYNL
jgi:hypothetical protein